MNNIIEAFKLGLEAANNGFPCNGIWNQYSCTNYASHQAWFSGHRSA